MTQTGDPRTTQPRTTQPRTTQPRPAPAPDRPAGSPGPRVLVCGLGGVGMRAVELLHLAGVPVTVITAEADDRARRALSAWGVPLAVADPRSPQALFAAGLGEATAVVCVDGGDLQTLETGLLIRDLRPGVRLVVRLANDAVARAVGRLEEVSAVLDVATIAAPSIVEACLRRPAHRFDLEGEQFVAAETRPATTGTLRALYGDLAPVAVRRGDSEEVLVCPGRDETVAAGDRVTLLGTPAELAAAGVTLPPRVAVAAGRRVGRLRVLRGLLQDTDRPLKVVTAALLGLIVVASLVLRFGYALHGARLSTLDAFYFTVETVATVGFGEFTYSHQGAALEVFGIVVMILGVALLSTAFALVTNVLVSRRIASSLGQQRAHGMRDHVVVVGLGSVGVQVVEGLLANGRQVVVIERDENNRFLGQARARHVPVVIADATLTETLVDCGIEHAAAVAVLTSDDLTNVETALVIKEVLGDRWDRTPVVLRVFDRQLARTSASGFGFRNVRSTSSMAAPWFVGGALGLDILATFSVEQQPFLVARLTVLAGGGLDGLAMQDLSASTRVVAIGRVGGGLEHPPRRGTRFAGGDRAYLLGPYQELLRVLARGQGGAGRPPS